jgi:hypothetical protein
MADIDLDHAYWCGITDSAASSGHFFAEIDMATGDSGNRLRRAPRWLHQKDPIRATLQHG